jgi:hypothetical protein
MNHGFRPFFCRKFSSPETKVYGGGGVAIEHCGGQAAVVCADHVNFWWGVKPLIPLLKHTNELYFV